MMTNFTCRWDLSDVTFKVDKKKLYASKTILCMWSPVLKAMFCHEFREKYSDEIELPGKEFDDILELFQILHPPNKDLNETNVCRMLPLAREYQMDELTKRCERFLIDRPPSVQSLVLAEEFTLKNLRQQCLEFINSSNLREICAEQDFDILSCDTQVNIFREKAVRYEEQLLEVRAIIQGNRPQQIRFRAGGTLCTFSCSDVGIHDNRAGLHDNRAGNHDSRLPHTAGTDTKCKTCATYMLRKILELITDFPSASTD